MRKILPLQTADRDLQELPFFILLTLILSGMSIWSVVESPALQRPLALIPFFGLVVLHLALHWSSLLFSSIEKWLIPYFIVQGILAFIIAHLSGNAGMIFGLYMALIGESFGILRLSSWTIAAVGGYLVLSLINFGLLSGWNNILWGMLGILPMVLFVAIYVTLYNRQSEARAQAQKLLADLEAAHRELAEYAARIEDLTIANERQRIARELHDTLSQGLAGLILQLEAVDANLASNRSERAQAIVRQMMEQARGTLSGARSVIGDLRQEQARKNSLGVSLTREVDHFIQTAGIPCALEIGFDHEIAETLCDTVTRITAEALTNIARHSRAGQACVSLSSQDDHLLLEIKDDGCGFDLNTVKPGHFGLLGMQERARLVQGDLEIHTSPDKGTTLLLKLPL